ncbi:unnamed protein product [Cylindrotheca closterium]|uniref:Uncharacterized protein n=1 Tax=Cylindrotheca closterium TaxID=2856 RepID=A0AAD2CHQ5_9STRA|nr:unnamed protein product [Cylindrotheca closterium]
MIQQRTTLFAQVDEIMTDVCHPTRRHMILGGLAATLVATTSSLPAEAKYGTSTNMEMPNYIEYLIEKNEAGGNPEQALYKGADPTVLLKRLQEANKRLAEIPTLTEEKKWSQIQGLITGPLGTLGVTINQIATTDSPANVKDAAKKVKGDVIAIGQAAAKKSGPACTDASRLASRDLEQFVKLAFEL